MACSRDAGTAAPLAGIPLGTQVTVSFVCAQNPALQHKLLAMGLVAGAVVEVVGAAPFGDPLLIQINQGRVALRREEAFAVEVVERE